MRLVTRASVAAAIALLGAAAVVLAARNDDDANQPRGAGTWETDLASSPFERSEVGAARIGDRIYVVGGFFGDGRTTNRLAAYDISDDRWLVRRPLPTPVNHPGVTALAGRLFVLGGQRGAEPQRSSALFSYHPRRNRWRRLPGAPTARAALGLAAHRGKLYAVGGQTANNFELRQLEIYDVRNRRWRRRAPMPTGRNHLAAVFARGFLWAIGGRRAGGQNLAAVERYDPRRNRWRRMRPLNVPRSGIGAAIARRSLVVVGGEELSPGGTTIGEVERLRLAAPRGAWRLIEPMPTPRHGLGVAAKGGRLFALEGGPQPGLTTSNLVERLDLSAP